MKTSSENVVHKSNFAGQLNGEVKGGDLSLSSYAGYKLGQIWRRLKTRFSGVLYKSISVVIARHCKLLQANRW